MLERRRAGEWVARRVWEVPFAHRAKPASRGGHFRVTRHFRHLLEKNLHCLRLCSSAQSSFGSVVMMAKPPRRHSPLSGKRLLALWNAQPRRW
jgi:hypothetical protein